MKFARIELLSPAELPGSTAGIARWNTTLQAPQYALERAADMLTAKHLETGKVLVYPWSSVRHAEPIAEPAVVAAGNGGEAPPKLAAAKGRK